MNWIIWSYLAIGFSAIALLVPTAWIRRGMHLLGAWSASLLALIGAAQVLITGTTAHTLNTSLAILPGFTFILNPDRALFLLIAAAVYGLSVGFVVQDARQYPTLKERILPGLAALLYASMLTVFIAGAVTSFIFAWEIMSLALWALITFNTRSEQSRRAGYLTLALSEGGALAGLAGLLILAVAAHTSSLAGIATAARGLPSGTIWAGFLLTFFGFGVKTGITPVNVWMNDAYAAAPRSIAPLFSGATLNLGVFALWAIDAPLASHALWPALTVLVVGSLTAILGIVYALATHSLSRLLTQSSIENLGVVVAALGAGFAFAALGRPILAGLALVAGLYHMVNHSAYKTLLFLGAGGIQTATGTDDMNALGGLLRSLPVFGSLFLLGAFAIAALPPLNGFVSEWLTLESLLRIVEVGPVPVRITFALCGALLALTAGLVLTCFIMLAGTTLMGLPRSRAAATVKRIPIAVHLPMWILAGACFGLGVLATGVIPVLARLVVPITGTNATAALVPAFFHRTQALATGIASSLTHIGAQIGRGMLPLRGLVVLHSGGQTTPVVFAMSTGLSFAVIAALLLVVWALARGLRRRRRTTRQTPWDAGLVRLHPEMTYTATAFATPVRVLFDRLLRPVVAEHAERHGAFVTAVRRRPMLVHIVDRLTLQPLIETAHAIARRLARMHQGRVTLYAAYIVATLVALLLVASALLR